ncbi:FixH family protein [filamentous cyanobacterium LEGE 11480]|uniref:FixH family protein n=1 Tax=Romeriopsis navalis LEGE 11480 TaxID=2777977 RepID=A0A928VMK4_9CYAN|nr:FixH family protein [Romeriopsis navalis]MBE9030458.1 FixH family protein [Romeriopsis navalis LEGE 11480]
MFQKFALAAFLSVTLIACGSNASQKSSQPSDTTAATSPAKSDSTTKGMDHSKMGDTVKAKASKDIRQVSPSSNEVKMGDAEIVVSVLQENLTADDVEVKVSMPMEGEDPMTSMAIVEAGTQPNQFKIKTNFGMAGPWAVHVMAKGAEPATFAFQVK